MGPGLILKIRYFCRPNDSSWATANAPFAVPSEPCAYSLFQKRPGTEALTLGFLHDLLSLKAQTRGRHVHQLERTDWVTEPQPTGSVDVLWRRDAFLDKPHRFD